MYCAACVPEGAASLKRHSEGGTTTDVAKPYGNVYRRSPNAVGPPLEVKPGELPAGIYRVSAYPAYAGLGEKHSIRKNIESGTFILLDDGSLWEIAHLDKLNATLWLPFSTIVVVANDYGYLGFDYTLINTDDGSKAGAKVVGIR
jgi:hypothetical protein